MIERLEVQPNARSQLSFPTAVDVPAASKRSTVSYCGQRHRRTQAEPDETASDDEADGN
jgi:hypothetical protein